ncbi:hypothetical protein GW916_00160 [bacterium]|nr:hypothetical protein [bacterium]
MFESNKWGKSSLFDATRIQNIFAIHGFAPYILDLIKVVVDEHTYYAQVTEVLEEHERGEMDPELREHIYHTASSWGIGRYGIDGNHHHQYEKLLVDFQSFYFIDKQYEDQLRARATESGWGSNPLPYQSIEELGINGQRKTQERCEAYRLDEIDFSGATVLDYGCSSGEMCREALRRGAKYAIGLDSVGVAKYAQEVSNYLGYFNIDYYGGNFSGHTYQEINHMVGLPMDIVFYLSCQQLGEHTYPGEATGRIFFLEGHTGDHEETFMDKLKPHFTSVEYLGVSRDHSIRPVFRCIK